MSGVAYALEGVGRRVGAHELLAGVGLEIVYGRVLALVGPNGAGKSTLLSVLTGDAAASTGMGCSAHRAPSEGSLRLSGREADT